MASDTFSKIENYYKAGRLIPFIGAGLSKRFSLPDSYGVLGLLAKDLGYASEVFCLQGAFNQLVEYYIAEKGIGELRSLLDRNFIINDDAIKKSRSHMALPKMRFPVVYTTNFDRAIEQAYSIQSEEYDLISSIKDLAKKVAKKKKQVVKFHGTFANDKSLVISETTYFKRLNFEDPLDIKLRADILENSLLFIGYSFTDLNIRYMIHRLNQIAQKSVHDGPVAFMVTYNATDIQKRLLEMANVMVLELDPLNKDAAIDEMLEALKGAQ